MATKQIHNCDVCGKQIDKLEHKVKMPTKLLNKTKEVHCYQDKCQNVTYKSFENYKEIDICEECLLKIFKCFEVEDSGSILKGVDIK